VSVAEYSKIKNTDHNLFLNSFDGANRYKSGRNSAQKTWEKYYYLSVF
jgi:hypothetical protein